MSIPTPQFRRARSMTCPPSSPCWPTTRWAPRARSSLPVNARYQDAFAAIDRDPSQFPGRG